MEIQHTAARNGLNSIMIIQGGSNMTGTDAACLHTNQSRSYLNHLVYFGFASLGVILSMRM
jgi:hypothetical protein